MLDPPRDGIHSKALPKILDYGVDRIVYISCKVTSLARDLEMIQGRGYELVKCRAVDQFCQTVHTECVCLLSRKQEGWGSVTIHSHFTHMRKNSQQSCLLMLRILTFCLCGWSDWFQSDKNCQSASYKLCLKNLTAIFYLTVNSNKGMKISWFYHCKKR